MVDAWPDVGQGLSPVSILLTATTLVSTMSLVVFAVWQLSGDATVAKSLAVAGTGIGRCGTVKRQIEPLGLSERLQDQRAQTVAWIGRKKLAFIP